MSALSHRYDFVLLFDVANGNPNGDPDAGNMPRIDPDTNRGLITDVSLKRKIRNYVALTHEDKPGYGIYVQEGSILNEQHRKAYIDVRKNADEVKKAAKLEPKDETESRALTAFMCENFFDVRSFGAVMSTGINCGQVRGPVQIAFAQSIEPILPLEITITRMAATTAKEKEKKGKAAAGEPEGDGNERQDNRTMGRKHIVPYGLYRAHGFISAKLAARTGFSSGDLDLLVEALQQMFEHDRSAARGEMATRKLILFKHQSDLGNAPAHALFERVQVGRNMAGEFCDIDAGHADNLPPARKFGDYQVRIDRDSLPDGVEIQEY